MKHNFLFKWDLVYRLDTAKIVRVGLKLQQVWKGPLVVAEVISPLLFKIVDRKEIIYSSP